MKKILCLLITISLMICFASCGKYDMEWLDDNKEGVCFNIPDAENWEIDDEADYTCYVCLSEWDYEYDEPFSEYLEDCNHWDDHETLKNGDVKSINIYENQTDRDYYNAYFQNTDGLSVEQKEIHNNVFDYTVVDYELGSMKYHSIMMYFYNKSYDKYYMMLVAGLNEEEVKSYEKEIMDSMRITGEQE